MDRIPPVHENTDADNEPYRSDTMLKEQRDKDIANNAK